jgi:hypothetical protein
MGTIEKTCLMSGQRTHDISYSKPMYSKDTKIVYTLNLIAKFLDRMRKLQRNKILPTLNVGTRAFQSLN